MPFDDNIIEAMQPVITEDLETFIIGLSQMFAEIDGLARDTDTAIGWSKILVLDEIPAEGLPWLAQWVGVQTVDGLSDALQRDRIEAQTNQLRGTVNAITQAAQINLTGAKRVIIRERDGGNAYHLHIITFTADTPNSALVLAALIEQKPAGITLTYVTLDGQDYQILLDTHATYQAVLTDYANYQELLEDI